jgi:hypothetical protein
LFHRSKCFIYHNGFNTPRNLSFPISWEKIITINYKEVDYRNSLGGNGLKYVQLAIQWIGYGYEMARQILEDSFYAGEKKPENARVVVFHSSMEDSSGKVTACTNNTE